MARRPASLGLAAFLFVLAVSLALALGRERSRPAARLLEHAPVPLGHAAATTPSAVLAHGQELGASRVEHEPADGSATPIEGVEPRALVRGRALDPEGRSVAGAAVRLELRELALRTSPPENSMAGAPLRYATFADEEGRFALTLPLLDAARASLWIDAPDARASAFETFHWSSSEGGEPLVPGELALGDFVLQPTTEVTGRVLDSEGAPIVGAEVSSTLLDAALTEADGSFLLPRVRLGDSVRARKQGYAEGSACPVPTSGESARTELVLTLRRAPSIRGTVRDPNGLPLAGALVVGRDEVITCRGTWVDQHATRSTADGSFELFLGDRDGYHVEARHREPMRPWDETMGEREHELPRSRTGATNVELVLAPARSAHVQARDARSGEILRLFGVAAAEAAPHEDSWRERLAVPRIGAVPSGTMTLQLESWESWYRCEAPGYAPASGPIEPRTSAEQPQVIELEPGARLRGRVARGAHWPVVLDRRLLRMPEASRVSAENGTAGEADWHCVRALDAHAGRERIVRCAADGSFAFEGLSEGTYRLLIRAAGALPTRVENLRVRSGATLELGTLEAHAPASVEGVVELAAGASPVGLVVRLGRHGASQVLASDGRFEFAGLAAGDYELSVDDHADVCFSAPALPFSVALGERKQLEWDLTSAQPAELRVCVTDRGRALQGVSVELARGDSLPDDYEIGETDAAGRVSRKVPLASPPLLVASSERSVPLGWYSLAEALKPGEVREVELALECGALELSWSPTELPAEFFADPNASIELVLADSADQDPLEGFWCVPANQFDGRWLAVALDRSLRIDRIAAGVWHLEATISFEVPGTGEVELPTRAEIEIRQGMTTRVRMRP